MNYQTASNFYFQDIETCPYGTKVLLLTKGMNCIIGVVNQLTIKDYLGYAPLPRIPRELHEANIPLFPVERRKCNEKD
jgi:hypothetical protein